MTQQQQFDFSAAGRRKQALRELRLPRGEKSILWVIVSHGGDRELGDRSRPGCTASQETLGAETGYARETVCRLLARLRRAGLVDLVRQGRGRDCGVGADVRICWGNLLALWEDQRAGKDRPPPAAPSLHCDIHCDIHCDATSHKGSKALEEKSPTTSSVAARTQAAAPLAAVSAPPRSLRSAPAYRQEEEGLHWERLADELLAAGVDLGAEAAAECRQRGCSLALVRSAVAAWRARSDLGPGALYARLVRLRPGQEPGRGFPPPPPVALATVVSAKAETLRTAEQQQAQQLARDRDELAQREARYGLAVDALGSDERERLLPEPLRRLARKQPDSPLVRECLLRAMHNQETGE